MKKIIKILFVVLIFFGLYSLYSIFHKTIGQNDYNTVSAPTDTIE